MTYQPQEILEAARSIRPYLSELLDSDEAQKLDRELAELITQAQQNPTDISKHTLKKLSSNSKTRKWTLNFLKDKLPPEIEKGYQPIPGAPSPVSGLIKYACPFGDYVWYQRQVGDTIPNCPTHNVPLEKVQP
ncbi:MAG: hypothetical protein AB4038_21990 [Prochloraceae cyanobacterium]